jgi:hypothetical protein
LPVCKDLTGQKFGRLTVVNRVGENNGVFTMWSCKCDCGNECSTSSKNLIYGRTNSCGCLKVDNLSKRCNDLTGRRFGKLVVKEKTGLRSRGLVVWKCTCDCGGECNASSRNLLSGYKTSCGCLVSNGERSIQNLLEKSHIKYEPQKYFSDLRLSHNSFAKFDFFVEDKYMIEFDGEQHFKFTGGWNTESHFTKTKKNDKIKNEYCKKNNIPIIRIPYTVKEIKLEDLLLETTKYLL